MAYYTREEIDQFVNESVARQQAENPEFASAGDEAGKSRLIKKYEQIARRQFIFNLYSKENVDESLLSPTELSAMAKDFGYAKGLRTDENIPGFEMRDYSNIMTRLNNAMLKKIDTLSSEASPEQILRQAPFLEMLHDNRFSLDEKYEPVLDRFKAKVDNYFAELDAQDKGRKTNNTVKENNAEKEREVWLNNKEFEQLRRLTSREEEACDGELLHKAEEVSRQIAQNYERQKRTILASKISAAFMKRFVVTAICNKKINQWKLNDTDKQLILDFISSTVKVKKLDEERAERVKGWIQEAVEGRKDKAKPDNKKKISRKEKNDDEQLVAVIGFEIPQQGNVKEKEENTGEEYPPFDGVKPSGGPREEDRPHDDDEDQLSDGHEESIAGPRKDDDKQKDEPVSVLNSLCSVIEKNFAEEKIAVKPVVAENKKELIYDLYPAGKTADQAPANGQLIFRKPNNAVIISEDFHHYIGLVKTLYDNGCRSIKIGDLSDDKEKNLRFKAALVVAGASRGMPVAGLETLEQLEELKAYNPKIELLIEKRKLRQEMKELREQLETAKREGKDTATIETQIQNKIAEGIEKHIEKGSIDPTAAKDRSARLKALENAGGKAKTVQAAAIQKALNNLKSK